MAEMNDSEFTRENLSAGLNSLSNLSARGVMLPDISPADFELQTKRQIDFMAGYIINLLSRIERLEAEREK